MMVGKAAIKLRVNVGTERGRGCDRNGRSQDGDGGGGQDGAQGRGRD